MRRVPFHAMLLATLLAAPLLASAQSSGQVLFANNRINPNTVNATECNPANAATVLVRWTPMLLSGATSAPVGGTYIIYGSNTAPLNGTQCQTVDNLVSPNNIRANTILNTNSSATNATITLSSLLAASGLSCANDGQTLYICVQGVQGGSNIPATNFAIASATVTISTTVPNVPNIFLIKPGDRALNVYWDPGNVGTGTGTTLQVEIQVTPTLSTTGAWDTRGTRSAGRFGASPARVEDLVNTVVYNVQARALTDAENASDFSPSGVTTGMPQAVNDFWDIYKAEGGRDTGGCGAGTAGPVGLGVLIATLALVRRRK
jgi:uncharacterized protein (TIGR03382 family)